VTIATFYTGNLNPLIEFYKYVIFVELVDMQPTMPKTGEIHYYFFLLSYKIIWQRQQIVVVA
jgi:hypothetical protein